MIIEEQNGNRQVPDEEIPPPAKKIKVEEVLENNKESQVNPIKSNKALKGVLIMHLVHRCYSSGDPFACKLYTLGRVCVSP